MAYTYSRPAPPNDASVLLPIAAVIAALLLAAAAVTAPIETVVVAAGLAVLALTAWRPLYSLPVLIIATMLGDLHISDKYVTDGTMLFRSVANYGILITPVEMVLVAGTLGLVIRLLFDDKVRFTAGPLLAPLVALGLIVLVGVLVGLSQGADMSALRSETRGLAFLPMMYLVGTHFMRTRADIDRVVWVIVIGANVMAVESIYRYWTYVRPGALNMSPDAMFGHENSLFSASVVLLLIARVLWSKNVFGEWKSIALMMLPTLALLVMKRRAGMVALDAGLILLCIVMLKDNLRLFLIAVPIAILGAGALLALTWNEPGGRGQLARSFQTVTNTGPQAEEDRSSDAYRNAEEFNLRWNIKQQPMMGLGFGEQYAFIVPVANVGREWPLWRFVPHNSVMWIWLKAGALAFIALLTLAAAACCRSTQLMTRLKHDALKPVAFSLAAMVVMLMMFSYVDIGLVSGRVLVFLGAILALIGGLTGLVAREDEQAATGAAHGPASS